AREAVDAAVFAPAIGIDRTVKANIGRIVTGDNLPGRVDGDRCLEWRQFVQRPPPIVEGDACKRLIPARGIAMGSPAAPTLVVDHYAEQRANVFIAARRR